MIEVRCHLPNEVLNDITDRCKKLNISRSEYLRALAIIDVASRRSQSITLLLDLLNSNICEMQQKLGIVSGVNQKYYV